MKVKYDKNVVVAFLNNLAGYIIFKLFRFFLPSVKDEPLENILFINSGQIGDLIVSSSLFENQDNLPHDKSFFLVIKENYKKIFNDYNGRFSILTYNYKKYKFNPVYKWKFLKKLRSLKAEKCFNVTAARGVINDEMSLLSGAKEIYCTENSWKYLTRFFGIKTDSLYTKVLFKEIRNEYEKHIRLMVEHFGIDRGDVNMKNKYTFRFPDKQNIDADCDYITLAPFATEEFRSWQPEKYRELSVKLSGKYKIIILGSKEQAVICDSYFNGLDNIVNICGKNSISEAATLMLGAKMHIGNDSGLTHVAFKLGIQTVGIIGGHNYGKFFPFQFKDLHGKFFYKQMDCLGCDCNCIYDKPYCLIDVEVREVYDFIVSVLK